MNRWRLWAVLLAAALSLIALATWLGWPRHEPVPVSDRQAAVALGVAMSKIDAPYVWASRGPDTFDSSGIIVHAYRQAVPGIEFRVGRGWLPRFENDANHWDMFTWNFQPVEPDELRPGDLVYITTGSAEVTHGMLFVDWVEPGEIMRVLDASSRTMRVGLQDWPITEEVRGQQFVAAGRLVINSRPEWAWENGEAP